MKTVGFVELETNVMMELSGGGQREGCEEGTCGGGGREIATGVLVASSFVAGACGGGALWDGVKASAKRKNNTLRTERTKGGSINPIY